MAGSKTAFLAEAILDFVVGGVSYTPPTNLYLALSTAAFDPTATGVAMNEVTGAGYARVQIPNNTTSFPAATAGIPSSKSNAADITWPAATADWGTPLSGYVCDAASNGNALYGFDLTATSDVASGDTFKIYAGTLIFSED